MAVANEWELGDEMPIINGPVVQFTGLPLIEGCIKCPTCSAVFGKITMPSHYSKCHPGIPAPKFSSLPSTHAQQLNKGQNKTLFEVLMVAAQPEIATSDTIIDHLRTSRDNLVPQYFPKTLDARALDPWMRFTGWHSYVQSFNGAELISLVGMPRKDETIWNKLAATVTAIYETGYEFIGNTNIIVLQKLKTDDLDGK